jgi:beta-galactosidase
MKIIPAVLFMLAQFVPLQAGMPLPKPSDSGVRFEIGEADFLLNDQPFVMRCGELHFTRIPPEYWRHRLQMAKAMGLNTVCAYLFWNYHELEEGVFDWSGARDVAEFCRIAQEEGLWVLLRPGPYSCAEWEAGGLPWWLFKRDDAEIRTTNPIFMEPAKRWIKEVGRVLGPLQVTRGGPILMVQVENEYGFFGRDPEYMGALREALIEAGFDVPLFACNPVHAIQHGFRPDLFQAANFAGNPESAFAKLRELQPKGPLMNAEFYPGWFDTWGNPHHSRQPGPYLNDLEWMLRNRASFSIYMAHGGTTFGFWPGADRPYKPDTTSYDYNAPISEAGWATEKFQLTRKLFSKYLLPGETLPGIPEAFPVIGFDRTPAKGRAPLLGNLPEPVHGRAPLSFEKLDQPFGAVLYRTTVPAGPATDLEVKALHDIGYVFLDGKPVGYLDRRTRKFTLAMGERVRPAQLDILVEAMGRVNFGRENIDRKGLHGPVTFDGKRLQGWEMFRLPLDAPMLERLAFGQEDLQRMPGFHRLEVNLDKVGDTFLDMRGWGKGMVWVNGINLGRFWSIGPTQTMFVPGAWLREGVNEFLVLDYLVPREPVLAGLTQPILNELRPELDTTGRKDGEVIAVVDGETVAEGNFPDTDEPQTVAFTKPVIGRYFEIEIHSSHGRGGFASIADLSILGADGQPMESSEWSIASVSSEEAIKYSASAVQAIDGQTANFWHSSFSGARPITPHFLVIDLGGRREIGGFVQISRQGHPGEMLGRVKKYKIHVGDKLQPPEKRKKP